MKKTLAAIVWSLLATLASAITYVQTWPTQISTKDGITVSPTPAQCRAAGYELECNRLAAPAPRPYTKEELAAQDATNKAIANVAMSIAMAKAAAISNQVESLRTAYRETTQQFCALSGLTVTNKLDTPAIQAAVRAAGAGPTALPLTQLAFSLFATITDLRRIDGDDAWDRI